MKKSKISSFIFIIIMIIIIYILFGVFKSNYFNGFIKAETTIGISEFMRDKDVKYSESYSYKITSLSQNDAAFYKEIELEPNTPYRVTCMVKTENVQPSVQNSDGGACISIIEASEISRSITGTNDWQQLELMFNSQNRTSVKLGFRLGGNSGTAQGTAWFSDFKLEKGLSIENSNWKVACFIFKNTDVEIAGERVKFAMSINEIDNIKKDMQKFQNSCKIFSEGKMKVDYDIYNIEEPLTTISYSEEHEYYFDPYDAREHIEDIVLENNYDYIFVAVKMGNDEKEIPVKGWIGLGNMDLYGIGFSNIRFTNNERNRIHEYNYRFNTFAEEVFIHEFLHTLERNSKEYGYNTVDLHDYEKYGYKQENLKGLESWYKDYMRQNIYDVNSKQYVGLDEKVYVLKPVNEDSFRFAVEIEFNNEPKNIIEEIKSLFNVVANAI